MHVYCVPHSVKRHGIVKEILMFALCSLDTEIFGKWSQIQTLDITKCLNSISFLWIDLTYKCFVRKKQFSKMYKLNAIQTFSKMYKFNAI